jgi:hypothetical protein
VYSLICLFFCAFVCSFIVVNLLRLLLTRFLVGWLVGLITYYVLVCGATLDEAVLSRFRRRTWIICIMTGLAKPKYSGPDTLGSCLFLWLGSEAAFKFATRCTICAQTEVAELPAHTQSPKTQLGETESATAASTKSNIHP